MKSFFSSALWNRTVPPVVRAQARAGRDVFLAETSSGTTIHADERAAQWQHPWRVSAWWHEKLKQWRATVFPGFVNGQDAAIKGVPLLDDDGGDGLHLPLGEIAAPPPRYFSALGVRDPDSGFSVDGDRVQIIDESWKDSMRPPPRKLYFADIQLSVARMGMAGAVQIEDVTGVSGRVASFYPRPVTSLLTSRGTRPELQGVSEFMPHKPPTMLERLLGSWVDPQDDILHVARVWMLSPPEWEEGPPDASWVPVPQQHCWWNLAHATRMPQIPRPFQPIRLFTGLAGGLGDSIGNQILAPLNDKMQQVEAAMQTVTAEGRFWTI